MYDVLQDPYNINSITEHIINKIHACYQFTSYRARKLGVQSRGEDFFIEQRRHIAALRMQLSIFDGMLSQHPIQTERVFLLMLQILCHSALVNMSTLFNMCEGDWDFFSPSFQKIITNAEGILQVRKLENHVDIVPIGLDFTPQLGILQPL